MNVQQEIGPALPPRALVHDVAREVQHLAGLARDCATTGLRMDVGRALALLDRARAELGRLAQ